MYNLKPPLYTLVWHLHFPSAKLLMLSRSFDKELMQAWYHRAFALTVSPSWQADRYGSWLQVFPLPSVWLWTRDDPEMDGEEHATIMQHELSPRMTVLAAGATRSNGTSQDVRSMFYEQTLHFITLCGAAYQGLPRLNMCETVFKPFDFLANTPWSYLTVKSKLLLFTWIILRGEVQPMFRLCPCDALKKGLDRQKCCRSLTRELIRIQYVTLFWALIDTPTSFSCRPIRHHFPFDTQQLCQISVSCNWISFDPKIHIQTKLQSRPGKYCSNTSRGRRRCGESLLAKNKCSSSQAGFSKANYFLPSHQAGPAVPAVVTCHLPYSHMATQDDLWTGGLQL